MKRNLEDIGTRFYTMVAIDLNERYKFMQVMQHLLVRVLNCNS